MPPRTRNAGSNDGPSAIFRFRPRARRTGGCSRQDARAPGPNSASRPAPREGSGPAWPPRTRPCRPSACTGTGRPLRSGGRARCPVLFRGADPLDHVEVVVGVGVVLVRRQVVGACPDQAVEGGVFSSGAAGLIQARRGQQRMFCATYWWPRRNAWMFFSTATLFTRIASSMAFGGSGSAPLWKPAPTKKTLANWSSPNSPRRSCARRAGRSRPAPGP